MSLSSLCASACSRLRLLLPRRMRAKHPLIPVVRLTGAIGAVLPFRQGLSISTCAPALERAFGFADIKGVAIVVNSPGGSAVQSHLIFRRIRALAEEKKVPVFVFVEDAAASGGYMIACAADEFVVNPMSIVGSIGVVGGSFGFHRLIDKIGIERRLYTSGEHKAMLDPFLPENPEDVERLKAIQKEIHERFIALVKCRRGAKLTGPEDTLFSGEYWTGHKAVSLGLADATGDLRSFLRGRFGDKVVTPLIAPERGWFGRKPPGILSSEAELGTGIAEGFMSALETRALWAKYGL
jgi:serine protease SohB